MVTSLVEQVSAIAEALDRSDIPWALGGALALAYATREPRGTRDIDVNVFVSSSRCDEVFAALPAGVRTSVADRQVVENEEQVRLWWDSTPVDLFFASAPFHLEVAHRCRVVPFAGRTIRVLSAEDLAVFKAMFDRSKDWVDIETMIESGALNVTTAAERLYELLGSDERVERLRRLAG